MLTSQQTFDDHPQPNQLVIGVKGKYRIEKYEGEGVTSLVYKATIEEGGDLSGRPTALKILRTDASADAKSSFNMEMSVLPELRRAEREAKDNLSSIPEVYEAYQGKDGQFLALEFVQGEPLNRTLDRDGYMEEAQALAIAAQVLRVLDLLHSQVRRSYTDLQLQNIWWRKAEGEAGYQVKVMDWNHVSYQFPAPEGVPVQEIQRDLARFGTYLYRMLTGKGANEHGETERALERRAGEQWEAVSLGARQIVLCALYPTRDKRFPDTAKFRSAVDELYAAWKMNWQDLDGAIDKLLEKLEKRFDDALAQRAKALLDVFLRNHASNPRTRDEAERFQEQLNAVLEPQDGQPQRETTDAWKAGQNYYRAGHYEEAGKRWRKLAEGSGRLGHWRWVMLADAGLDRPKEFEAWRADLEKAVIQLDQEQWSEATVIIERANSGIQCRGLEALCGEVQARRKIEDGRRQENSDSVEAYRAAADSFRSAEAVLASVPYEKLLRDEFGWQDLTKCAQQLDNQADARAAAEEMIRKLAATVQSGGFDTQLEVLRGALKADPRNFAAVEMCLSKAREEDQKGEHGRSIALLDVALLYGSLGKQEREVRDRREKALEAARAQRQAALEAEEERRRRERCAGLQEKAGSLVQSGQWLELHNLLSAESDTPAPQVVAPDDQKMIDEAYSDAIMQRNVPLAQVLRRILDQVQPDAQHQAARSKDYDKLINALRQGREEWLSDMKRTVSQSVPATIADRTVLIDKINRQLPFLSQDEDTDLRLQAQTLLEKLAGEVATLEKTERDQQAIRKQLSAARDRLAELDDIGLESVFKTCSAISNSDQAANLSAFASEVEQLEAVGRALREPVNELNRAEQWSAEAERLKSSPDADLLGDAVGAHATAAMALAGRAGAAASAAWSRFLNEPAPVFQRPARIGEKAAGLIPAKSQEAELALHGQPSEGIVAKNATAAVTPKSSQWSRVGRTLLGLALTLIGGGLVWLMFGRIPQLEARLSQRVGQVETPVWVQGTRVAEVLSAVKASDGRVKSLGEDVSGLSEKIDALQVSPVAPPTSVAAATPTSEPTLQPTVEPPASTAVEATIAPTSTITLTAAATVPPDVLPPDLNISFEAGPEVLYDLPTLTIQANADETIAWNAETGQLRVVTKDGSDWLVTGWLTSTVQTSQIPTPWKGEATEKLVRLSPDPDDPPLAAGQYTLTVKFTAEPQPWIIAGNPMTFTVAPAPVKATLLVAELRKEAIAVVSVTNLQKPQPIAVGSEVEVLYWKDDSQGGVTYRLYQVRATNTRTLGWVMGPEKKEVIRTKSGELKDVPSKQP